MKLKRVALFTLASIMLFTTGIFAGANVTKITAYLNKGLTIKVDGEVLSPTENDGSRIYPIVYNGRTFLPAKAVAEALGATVDYDSRGNGTITITSGTNNDNEGQPTKDSSSNSSNNKNSTSSSSGSKSSTENRSSGTKESPVPVGEPFGWDLNDKILDNVRSGHVSVTLNSYKTITLDDVVDLGFSRPKADSNLVYALINVTYDVKNAKLATSDYCKIYDSFLPYMYGIDTKDNNSIIGGSFSGFKNAIQDKVKDIYDYDYVEAGKEYSFKVTGDILMPINKGEKNLLVYSKSAEYYNYSYDELDKIKVFFSLD